MFYFSGLESFYKRSGKSGHKCLDSVKSHFLASILVKPSWTNVSFPPTVKHSKCVLFLYVNGWSLSWKLLHYQLYELTWSGDKRPWIPNNCLAGKGKEGWAQPLEGREHLWKRTLNFVLALIGRVRLVLESRSGPEPSWRHHKELKQGCCRSRCVCTGYPSSPSEGKKTQSLASVIYLYSVKRWLYPEMLSGRAMRRPGTNFLPSVRVAWVPWFKYATSLADSTDVLLSVSKLLRCLKGTNH